MSKRLRMDSFGSRSSKNRKAASRQRSGVAGGQTRRPHHQGESQRSSAPAASDRLAPSRCAIRLGARRPCGQMRKISAWKFHFAPPSTFTSLDHLVGGSNREKVPFAWHTLESMHAPVLECDAGADDQVLHGA